MEGTLVDYRQYVIDTLFEMSKHGFKDFVSIERDESNKGKGSEFFDLDFAKANELGALNNIKKATIDKTGKIIFELYDQLDILAMLDKVSSGSGVRNPESDDVKSLTLEQIIRSRKKISTEDSEPDDD